MEIRKLRKRFKIRESVGKHKHQHKTDIIRLRGVDRFEFLSFGGREACNFRKKWIIAGIKLRNDFLQISTLPQRDDIRLTRSTQTFPSFLALSMSAQKRRKTDRTKITVHQCQVHIESTIWIYSLIHSYLFVRECWSWWRLCVSVWLLTLTYTTTFCILHSTYYHKHSTTNERQSTK